MRISDWSSDVCSSDLVDQALVAAVGEQSVHQCDVRTGADRQMQVGILAGFRPAGVDDDELRAALSPRRLDALVDDRMAPGGVRSDKDDQVRLIKVGIDRKSTRLNSSH